MAATQKVTTVDQDWLKALVKAGVFSTKTTGSLGTGSTAAAIGDTDLDTPIAGSAKLWESASQTGETTTFEYKLAFTELNSVGDTIKEIGVWNTAQDALHARVVLDSGDYITKDNTKEYYFRLIETKAVTIN